jgi:hypothetical protein
MSCLVGNPDAFTYSAVCKLLYARKMQDEMLHDLALLRLSLSLSLSLSLLPL